MKKIHRIITGVLSVLTITSSLFACGGNDAFLKKTKNGLLAVPTYEKDGLNGLHFYSSDSSFDTFINDYYSRHIRDLSNRSIGVVKQGSAGGRMYQRYGDAKYISFYNATEDGVYGYSPMANLRSSLDANALTIYGSVMDVAYPAFMNGTSADQVGGLGWPFVSGYRTGNYSMEFTGADNANNNEEESKAVRGNWTINGDALAGSLSGNGFWNYDFSGSVGQSVLYESPTLSESLQYVPLVEISFLLKDSSPLADYYSTIDDLVLSWKFEGDTDWYSMSYYESALNNPQIKSDGFVRTWFPVYLDESWDKTKTLEGLKFEIRPKDGKKMNLHLEMNYIRLQTDTRLTTNNSNYVMAMEEYISYTGDREMLEKHLSDIRKATMFEIYALDNGHDLMLTDYIWGKTTTHVADNKYGLQGNGWYDCIPTGTVSMEANIGYYNSLLAMARIEETAIALGIANQETSIRNPRPSEIAGRDIAWTFTPQTLRALADRVKTNIRKDYDKGGLWNPKTGRFAWAIYDEGTVDIYGKAVKAGDPMDFGHTEINLNAVLSGVATDEQAESILSWINGTRIVDGDEVVGDEIYFFEFAPRTNTGDVTIDCSIHHSHGQKGEFITRPNQITKNFGEDIQNGGASIHVSFFDLEARNAFYGADDSFERFSAIKDWYLKVLKAEKDTEMILGNAFYSNYYDLLFADTDDKRYSLSGGGKVAAIGLDAEFYESAMLYATIPDMYFGLDSTKWKQLTVAPDVPSQLKYMAMSNLMFHDIKYNLYVENDRVVLSGVRGEVDGQTLKVELKGTKNSTVYVNNKKYTGFTYDGGKITLEIPFGQCVVEVK